MAHQVLALPEVIAVLTEIGASATVIEKFRARAEQRIGAKPQRGDDHVTVASGFGSNSQRGFVELTINDQRSQMDAAKAREIGLMLIESAEAAISDQCTIELLKKIGIDSDDARARVLLDLREIRQGTRGIAWPH